MARIRSVHPKLFTDRQFVSVSMAARVLWIGLLTEADDHGIFVWDSIEVKMRLMPADTIDVAPLLEELEAAGKLKSFHHEGRKLGAIRNFCKFQSPKKPKYTHVLPDEFRTYLGLTVSGSVPDGAVAGVGSVPEAVDAGSGTELDRLEGGGSSAKNGTGSADRRGEEGKGEEDRTITPSPNPNGVSPPAGKRRPRDAIAFEQGPIRLTAKDLEKWRKAYPNLSLESELMALSEWATHQPNWFHAVIGALAKKQRDTALRIEQGKADAAARAQPPPPVSDNQLWDRGL